MHLWANWLEVKPEWELFIHGCGTTSHWFDLPTMQLCLGTGPMKMYELNTHAEFAHFTIGAAFDGVSFPWGISISFDGEPSIIGVKNLCIRA